MVNQKVEKCERDELAKGAVEVRIKENLLEYVERKVNLVKEKYADGSDRARVRTMLRDGSLSVRRGRR